MQWMSSRTARASKYPARASSQSWSAAPRALNGCWRKDLGATSAANALATETRSSPRRGGLPATRGYPKPARVWWSSAKWTAGASPRALARMSAPTIGWSSSVNASFAVRWSRLKRSRCAACRMPTSCTSAPPTRRDSPGASPSAARNSRAETTAVHTACWNRTGSSSRIASSSCQTASGKRTSQSASAICARASGGPARCCRGAASNDSSTESEIFVSCKARCLASFGARAATSLRCRMSAISPLEATSFPLAATRSRVRTVPASAKSVTRTPSCEGGR